MTAPWASAAAARAWLQECAWPLWLEHGIDRDAGGFREWLRPDLGCDAPYRRLRVAARQVCVFAQAAQAGTPGARDAVLLGLRFLRAHARQEDGGYAWRFHLDNAPSDLTRDLYDHAFVLLALSQAAMALPGDSRLPEEASALLAYLDARFAHAHGGYHEAIPDALPRRQNPHMHLLEALLAAHAAFGGAACLGRAGSLVDLFLGRMFQHGDGALPEFFDAAWRPERDQRGRFVVEPGHHYEWVWLLDAYARAAGQSPAIEAACARLMAHADRWGLDPQTGLVADAVLSDGTMHAPSFRLWPQTERLKAVTRRPDLSRSSPDACLALLRRFLDGARAGLWRERLTPDGAAHDEAAPASSLYHLTSALLDVTPAERAAALGGRTDG